MSKTADGKVTEALLQLVANGGNVEQTAKQVGVAASTLRAWKNDRHAERYRRLEESHGTELERQAVELARARMIRASEIEGELLERAAKATPDMVPQALRAVSDVKAKATQQVLTLTGRSIDPKGASTGDLVQLLESMAAKGFVRIAAGIDLSGGTPPRRDIDG